LGKAGSEGFPGNEHLPHLAGVLRQCLELGTSDGAEALESFGEGPLLARFVYQTLADPAGHQSGHWVLARPGLGPVPSRGERPPSPPLVAAAVGAPLSLATGGAGAAVVVPQQERHQARQPKGSAGSAAAYALWPRGWPRLCWLVGRAASRLRRALARDAAGPAAAGCSDAVFAICPQT